MKIILFSTLIILYSSFVVFFMQTFVFFARNANRSPSLTKMEIHAITHFLFTCKAEGGREYVLLHRGLKYILRLLLRKTRVLHGKQQQQLFYEIQYIVANRISEGRESQICI